MQRELLPRLELSWDGREVSTVGGVDVSVKGGLAQAAILVLDYPGLQRLESATVRLALDYPYVPGLLAFREGPAILAAWRQLQAKPDLLLFDGHGIAHPRGLGLAGHMGLWLQRPSVGVAKSRLCGQHEQPGRERGQSADLRDDIDPRRRIGTVVRTRTDVKPVYVSPGHLIDLEKSVEIVLSCCTRYRLPEPIRLAHMTAARPRS